MKQTKALPNQRPLRWLAGGKSYHHPLVAPRAQYDAPGCIIRSLHDAKVLRDQRSMEAKTGPMMYAVL